MPAAGSRGDFGITANRLSLLDGLRGIAAIGVMLYHAEVTFGVVGPFWRGYLFVDFFFLLSGFVLTLSAERRMNAGGGTAGFLRARVARLWPMTAIGVILGMLAAALAGTQNLAGLAALGLLMIPIFAGTGQLFPLNGPQWSLFLELVANLAHGLVLRRLGDRGLAAVIVLSGAALAATTVHFGSNTLGPFSFNWWWALPRLFFSYTLGVWFGRRWQAGRRGPKVSWQLAFALPPLCLLVVSGMPIPVAAGDLLMVMALFPLLFWIAAASTVPENVVVWLKRLGALSFPLYAVHIPLLEIAAGRGKSNGGMVLAILATLAAAWLIDRGLDAVKTRRRTRFVEQAA